MPTEKISKCCGDRAIPDYASTDPNETEVRYSCLKCERDCETEEVCEFCGGTGEVTTMEQVYAGEPHMAPIGTATCSCRLQAKEYEHEQN